MAAAKIENHYEKWGREWQERFLTLDQEALMKKLPELKEEGDCLTIRHFGRKYAISRRTGELTASDRDENVSLNTRLNIYTLLWYCSPLAMKSGEWVPFRQLKDASPFGPAFQKGVVDALAATFSGHMEALLTAGKKLGARRLSLADAGFELDAFACIPMRVLFWEGDEEFPAQANILFDKNATSFIHVESIVTIASEGLERLTEAAGLPLKGSPFTSL